MSILDRLFVSFIAKPLKCPNCKSHQSKFRTIVEAECYCDDDFNYWLQNPPNFELYVGNNWRNFMLTEIVDGYKLSETFDKRKNIVTWSFYSCQFCVHKFKQIKTTKHTDEGFYWPLSLP